MPTGSQEHLQQLNHIGRCSHHLSGALRQQVRFKYKRGAAAERADHRGASWPGWEAAFHVVAFGGGAVSATSCETCTCSAPSIFVRHR